MSCILVEKQETWLWQQETEISVRISYWTEKARGTRASSASSGHFGDPPGRNQAQLTSAMRNM